MTISVRNMRTPAGGAVRGRRKKLGTGVLLLLGIFAGLISFAPSAFAHHPEISVQTECGNKVVWTSQSWSNTNLEGDHSNVIIEYSIDEGAWTAVAESPISYNVPTSPVPYDPHTGNFTVGGTPDHVEMRARTIGTWGNGVAGGQVVATGDVDFPTNCADLDLTAGPVCAANGGLDLTIKNNGSVAGSLTINYTQNPGPDSSVSTGSLAAGASTTVNVPILENSSYSISFTGDKGDDGTPGTITGTRNCLTPPNPDASVQWECGEANAVVAVSNSGQESVTATILKNNVAVPGLTGVAVPGNYNVPITGADEDTTVVIKVTFSDSGTTSDKTLNVPVSCDEPEPTIGEPVCAEGGLAFTLGNEDGEDEATFTIVVNGGAPTIETVAAGDSETVIVPVAEDATVSVSITSGSASYTNQALKRDCQKPGATLSFSCAAGGVVVDLTNTGSETTTINVGGTNHTVAGGGTKQVIVPVAEGASYSVTVTGGDGLNKVLSGTRDCEELSGSVTFTCAEGGVAISVTNTGDLPTSIQINGGAPIQIAVGDTYDATIPVAEGAAYSVTVTGDGFSQTASGTRNCEELSGSVVFECAEGGVAISVTNTGEITTSIQVNGGAPIPIAVGDTYDATIPVAEGAAYSVTVTGDGFDQTASGTRNCEEPAGTVVFECAEGGVVISITNTGEISTDIQVNGGAPISIAAGDTYDATIPVAEGAAYSVTVTGDGLNESASGTRDCEELDGTVVFECAEGGVVVSVTNTGDLPTAVVVNGGAPVEVAVGDTYSVTIPVAEGAPYSVTITGEGLDESTSGTRDCEEPGIGSANLECAEGGVVVALTNDGELSTIVLVDGNEVEVPAGTTAEAPVEVLVPVDENAAYDFTVVGDGLDQSFSGVADCLLPEPSVDDEVVCASGGLNVILRNTGDDTAAYVITSPALPDGGTEVTVAAGEVESVLIPLDEDASTDVVVTSGGDTLFDSTLTRDCETVGGEVVTPTPLPRTGANTTGLLGLAGTLLLAGLALTTGSRRREARLS